MSKKKKQQVIEAFKSADKNGDGKIDLEEYVQHFKVIFYFFLKMSIFIRFFLYIVDRNSDQNFLKITCLSTLPFL